MVINKCLVGLLVFCFKLLVCTYRGTSSFMTSALDALVFVQVCVCVWGGGNKENKACRPEMHAKKRDCAKLTLLLVGNPES